MFFCEHCKLFKNTYIEKHLPTAASDSSYIFYKKLNKIIHEPGWPFVLSSFVLSLAAICYDSLSLLVTRCHSLPLVVTRCTTRLSFYKRLV